MVEASTDPGKARACEIGESNLQSFLDVLKHAIDDAASKRYDLVVCLLEEDGAPFIYPSEQSEKSLVRQMTELLREKAKVTGLINTWDYENLSIVFSHSTLPDAMTVAETVRSAIKDHTFERNGEPVQITVSLGLAAFPDDGVDETELMDKARSALQAARSQGGNCSVAASN